MIPVQSQALEGLRRVLGLGGSGSRAASGLTEFDDAVLQQVLDVKPIVRRGGTLAPSEGLYTAQIVNTHVGAGTINTEIDPFAIVTPTAAFPSPIPPGFDFWLFRAYSVYSVAAQLTSAQLRIIYPVEQEATAVVPLGDTLFPYAVYNAEVTFTAIVYGRHTAGSAAEMVTSRPTRLVRGQTLRWSTEMLGAVGVAVHMLWGLFPITLGQDLEV